MKLNLQLSLEWLINIIGFITAFSIGLWQYWRAQRQEKVRLLLPLISEFETDAELQAACHLIDYDAGSFVLGGQSYTFTNAELLEAMRVVAWDYDWEPKQEAIREVLDRFFDFFEKLHSFVSIGLVAFGELKYFYYYLELLAGIEKYKGPGFERALEAYLEAYRFNGCRACLDAYRRLPASEREELRLSVYAIAPRPDAGRGQSAS